MSDKEKKKKEDAFDTIITLIVALAVFNMLQGTIASIYSGLLSLQQTLGSGGGGLLPPPGGGVYPS